MGFEIGNAIRVFTKQGKKIILDLDGWIFKQKHRGLFISKFGYVQIRPANGMAPKAFHRFFIDAPKDKLVDHKNKNKLDNRRSNLRLCDAGQNMANRACNKKRKTDGGTGFKGVSRHQRTKNHKKCWRVIFRGAGMNIEKWFYTPEEAARAYDYYAFAAFGEFAQLNFPNEVTL